MWRGGVAINIRFVEVMGNLRFNDKRTLEKAFSMNGGYVLDFNNNTVEEFVRDCTGINIYEEKYSKRGTSKANRLRQFWSIESNIVVAKLIGELLEYWRSNSDSEYIDWDEVLYEKCKAIVTSLEKEEDPIKINESLAEQFFNPDFKRLRINIEQHLQKAEYDLVLDRLHTYMMNFSRSLCQVHKLEHEKTESLNALFGKYVKQVASDERLDSQMSIFILKSSISILSAYNGVRNEQSFAHANKPLNIFESKFIVSNLVTLIDFIDAFESEYFADMYADYAYEQMKENGLPF